MNKHHVKYLLVGGGVASAAAGEAIRGLDKEGEVLLISQEATRPYHRPPLSKEALRERRPRADFFTHEPGWFVDKGIELRTGRRVAQLDTARHAVILDDAQEISYDKLLLAVGASPRHLTVPGAHLPGLHYLRTFEDLERIVNAVDKARAEGHRQVRQHGRGRVAVIGSGLLGAELAATLTQVGLEVDLLLRGEYPWSKFAGESTGKWVARFLEQHGVQVHPHGAPLRLEGDGRVQRLVTGGGETIVCDFAVAAVGVVPNKELLRGSPIAAERAILTDAHCRTNVADVYAAGDCAAIFDPLFGKHRLLEHYDSAALVGALAGRNMAGVDEVYAMVNHYASELFDARVEVWGEARHVHHRLLRGLADVGGFVEFGLTADDCVSQVVAVNFAGAETAMEEMVRRRQSLAGKEEAVKDPQIALGNLVS